MASAIYRSGFFCHHPEAQERKAHPRVPSPLTSVSQKTVGSPFRAPCPFTQTTLESALSVNCRSSSGSKYSCPWAHTPSFGGTQPKPSAAGGLDLSRQRLRAQLARPDAAPEGAGRESPAGLVLTLLALLPPRVLLSPWERAWKRWTAKLFLHPASLLFRKKHPSDGSVWRGPEGSKLSRHDP